MRKIENNIMMTSRQRFESAGGRGLRVPRCLLPVLFPGCFVHAAILPSGAAAREIDATVDATSKDRNTITPSSTKRDRSTATPSSTKRDACFQCFSPEDRSTATPSSAKKVEKTIGLLRLGRKESSKDSLSGRGSEGSIATTTEGSGSDVADTTGHGITESLVVRFFHDQSDLPAAGVVLGDEQEPGVGVGEQEPGGVGERGLPETLIEGEKGLPEGLIERLSIAAEPANVDDLHARRDAVDPAPEDKKVAGGEINVSQRGSSGRRRTKTSSPSSSSSAATGVQDSEAIKDNGIERERIDVDVEMDEEETEAPDASSRMPSAGSALSGKSRLLSLEATVSGHAQAAGHVRRGQPQNATMRNTEVAETRLEQDASVRTSASSVTEPSVTEPDTRCLPMGMRTPSKSRNFLLFEQNKLPLF
ncbi:unnamed protein product [Amoebophrya sp. A25]|nr:unnamed protein product [Amoebophrya sp. A25]|eukprot:GSA25T00003590001.1